MRELLASSIPDKVSLVSQGGYQQHGSCFSKRLCSLTISQSCTWDLGKQAQLHSARRVILPKAPPSLYLLITACILDCSCCSLSGAAPQHVEHRHAPEE
jgi:hypothetical protein